MPVVARFAASLLLLGLAAALLAPQDEPPRVAWSDLIAPLAVGQPVARGYVLGSPRRGAGNDVVYVARRGPGPDGPAGRIELHILDRGRWPDVAETRSFGVGWEMPRPGALGAPHEDADAVTAALVAALARNDTGFASVDSIPLEGEPAPPLVGRVLARLAGVRGIAAGVALTAALLLLAGLPGGTVGVALLLLGLGLALRLPALDLPFTRDQDVQRLFTGNASLGEIATGVGLEDRHPPLYFFVLHGAQRFGQSEAVGRAPAALAGALVGPAILLAAAWMSGAGGAAVVAALAATVSPELVARSREVSEIPLYALILLAASSSLVAAARRARPLALLTLALSHALAFYTYYLAPFTAGAHAALLLWRRGPNRRVVAAFAAGILAATPAILLGAATLVRDWDARATARAFPTLAWGEHSPLPLALHMARIAADGLGAPLCLLGLAAMLAGALRRDLAVLAPALGFWATFAGIAVLSPIARVQAYYVATVLPLGLLALAVFRPGAARRRTGAPPAERRSPTSLAWNGALALAVGAVTVPLLAGTRSLYVPDADAFMPRFARVVATRPEATVVTVAHYDKALLAYYLARARGRSIAWDRVDEPGYKRIEALVLVHFLDAGSEAAAVRRLDELAGVAPILVIERDAVLLPRVGERLARCELLAEAPTARLLAC